MEILWLFLIIAIVLLVSQENNIEMENFEEDMVLSNLYRRIHLLEQLARSKINRNNDIPGGDNSYPNEPYKLALLEKEINSLKKKIATEINKKKSKLNFPTLYSDNPMINLPSVPGNYPYFKF